MERGGQAAGQGALERQVVTRSPGRLGSKAVVGASQPAAVQEARFRTRLNPSL